MADLNLADLPPEQPPYCRRCGHGKGQHEMPTWAGMCHAWEQTGGGLGMKQRCGCVQFMAPAKRNPVKEQLPDYDLERRAWAAAYRRACFWVRRDSLRGETPRRRRVFKHPDGYWTWEIL